MSRLHYYLVEPFTGDPSALVARQQDVDGVFLQLTTAVSVTEVGAMNTAFGTVGTA